MIPHDVTSEQFKRWSDALGTRPDVTFRSYRALKDVVRDIAAWILTSRI